jgi:hypothetical protein
MSAPVTASKWFRLRRFPTWRVWLIFFMLTIPAFVGLAYFSYGWLAITQRVENPTYIVVEGWAPDYVVNAAQQEFDDANAELIITTGLPLEQGAPLLEFKDYATLAATTLAKNGADPGKIYPVAASAVTRERTAAMAEALREALSALNVPAEKKRIQLLTHGTHARRSRWIYQRILGPEWQVGIVAVPTRSYPASHWYRHSSGVKGVIDELAALTVVACGGE